MNAVVAERHPNYPEYENLVAQARRESSFVGPGDLAALAEVAARRGPDWCTAVVGAPWSGLRGITVTEGRLLRLADAAGLEPPLPDHVIAARAADAERRRDLEAQRGRLAAADARRWAGALAGCHVEVEVRANVQGRRTGTGLDAGPLRHAVPVRDAYSGTATRPRVHSAGRAVCETAGRARPRLLGDPVDAPATCVSCVALTPKLRPAP